MGTSSLNIDPKKLPKHVAIIMDGNGRWAKQKGYLRVMGHRQGVKTVREITEAAAEMGIQYLTLYAFSTENWNRPKLEVNALMSLLVETMSKEIKTLQQNNIRLQTIGNLDGLPQKSANALKKGVLETADNDRMTLILALNYSGRSEITEAAKALARRAQAQQLDPEEIDEELFAKSLYTRDYPDPELLIRTSGETRLSNFLLWQLAYAEFYFTNTFWPDFKTADFHKAIQSYQNRERRFGMISEQL